MNTFACIHHTNPIPCRRLAFVLLRNVPENSLTTKQTRILGNCVSKNCFNFWRVTNLNSLNSQGLPTVWHLWTLLQWTSDINRVSQKLVELKNELCSPYPELNSQFCHGPPLDKREQRVENLQNNLPHSCDWIIEMGNGAILKNVIMTKFFRKEYSVLILKNLIVE